MVWKTLLICGISFLAVSVFRHFYNAPRPYETDPSIKPPKQNCKKGHSFPSRHVFCAFLIASTIAYFCHSVGLLLFVPAVFLAFLRKYLHYHSTKDVLCGAILGILCAAVGFGLFV
ncbi:MAG: phosphatase PAP2 family protein [Clostridia bacterium]